MASLAIVWNFFEKQWTKNHPQYLSGLSRAAFYAQRHNLSFTNRLHLRTFFNDINLGLRFELD